MIEIVNGKKYRFEINSENLGMSSLFSIKAICKLNRKTSCINNLNVIFSEFAINIDDPKVADSTWVVTNLEAQSLGVTAKELLKSTVFIDYLERHLDEDRMLGEWENVYNPSTTC